MIRASERSNTVASKKKYALHPDENTNTFIFIIDNGNNNTNKKMIEILTSSIERGLYPRLAIFLEIVNR